MLMREWLPGVHAKSCQLYLLFSVFGLCVGGLNSCISTAFIAAASVISVLQFPGRDEGSLCREWFPVMTQFQNSFFFCDHTKINNIHQIETGVVENLPNTMGQREGSRKKIDMGGLLHIPQWSPMVVDPLLPFCSFP